VRAGDRIGFSWEYDIAIVFDQSATNTRPFDYCHGSVVNQRVGNTYVLDRHMGVTRAYSFQVTYENIDEGEQAGEVEGKGVIRGLGGVAVMVVEGKEGVGSMWIWMDGW
jgi:hypothetical protein